MTLPYAIDLLVRPHWGKTMTVDGTNQNTKRVLQLHVEQENILPIQRLQWPDIKTK